MLIPRASRPTAGSADDGVLHGPESGGGSRRYAYLVVDVLDVVIGGLRRDEEPIGDCLRLEPPRREAQHANFATGEPARMFRPAGRGRCWRAVTGGYEHATGRLMLEHAL